jgi:tryptophan-rich sensory protein
MKIKNIWKLAFAVGISELAGIIGSVFTSPSIPTWYASLAKPNLAPPNWVFAPVWTTLFALMGVALFMVWREGTVHKKVKIAIYAFSAQLFLNVLWSAIFFGLRLPGVSFAEIIFLWVAILITAVLFRRVSKVAAWLLVPYLLWVGFASYLNLMIALLN